MVVIPGPVEFMMGSPLTEAGRFANELLHRRRISRTFALAAKPVTVAQYRLFDRNYAFTELFSPEPSCPVVGTHWYQAAAYCNWLSKQEGILEDQWCYETKQGQVTKLKENYLSLTGYRLPTEAEWECACRAGAATSRHYGASEELLEKYAWHLQNSKDRSWPVGSKKPNDWGFFDMHGNVWCWCQESHNWYPTAKDDGAIEDKEEEALVIVSTTPRVLRGGSFAIRASVVRSANRFWNLPTDRITYVGFRPARTFTAE